MHWFLPAASVFGPFTSRQTTDTTYPIPLKGASLAADGENDEILGR